MYTDTSLYLSDNFLVLDFETTNIEKGSALENDNRSLLACWQLGPAHPLWFDDGKEAVWGDEYAQAELVNDIEAADFIVAHGAKFELQWLARCGVDLRKVIAWDTLLAEKVLHGNLKAVLSLEATATRRGLGNKDAIASLLIKSGVCPSNIPRGMLEKYCAQDVALTHKIFLEQRKEIFDLRLERVTLCRNLLTPVLADVESYGMGMDAGRVHTAYEDYKTRYDALMQEFERMTGGINLKSPKQMREFLYEKMMFPEVLDYKGNPLETDTGEKATDKNALSALVATTPEQKEFKKLVNALAVLKTPMQNLTKMNAKADKGERMYAAFNQAIAQTHRLSSSARKGGMQFQNFDRAFKPCFVARKGYVIIEADFAQLEFRTAADLARDAVAEAAIRSGEDVHALAASILGIGRQAAKAKTFRPLFGGSSGTPKEKKYYAAFREKYATIYKTQTEWTYEVAKTKQLRVASGLIFYWPDTEIKSSGYVTNSTSIFNYPIQSFSFEVVALSLRAIWERIAELDCRILNTVHDSIILECSLESLDEVKQIVVDCMTNEIYRTMKSLYNYEFKIPLGIELKIAEHWADKSAETFKHEAKV